MRPWNTRAREVAYLLNPAFGANLLTAMASGYGTAAGMPLPLAFLALPIVLHKATRKELPKTTRTPMAVWMQRHPDLVAGLSSRVVLLKAYTQEALHFGLVYQLLKLGDNGTLHANFDSRRLLTGAKRLGGDVAECVSTSHFLGRWFQDAGTVETVLTLWRVRP